jgi:hypothetical protein
MKRYGCLKEAILSERNIISAEHNARKGKSNTYGVRRFDRRPELTLNEIKNRLENGKYRTSKYKTFKIYEPKER